MAKNKSDKFRIYLFVLITIVGCVLACSSIITNDYLKLVIVMTALCVGLFGVMKALGKNHDDADAVERK